MKPLKVIKTEAEYLAYVQEARALATAPDTPGSDEACRLELLELLIRSYEEEDAARHADPVDAIRHFMVRKGLKQKDLVQLMGGKNRVSEILARKRPLTKRMVEALHRELGIPVEVLIRVADSSAQPRSGDGA